MAILVSDLISFARAHIKLAPLVSLGGVANEPALSFAKDAVDKLLSPPFAWKWNRGSIQSFDTVSKQQTYTYSVDIKPPAGTITDFGWLERGYIEWKADTQTPKLKYNLDVVQDITITSELASQPRQVCHETYTGSDLTLRFNPIPYATIWTVYLDYQKAPPALTATTSNMGQIPDDFGRILRQLFLAFAFRAVDDRRYVQEMAIAESMIADKRGREDAANEAYPIIPDESIVAW